MKNISFIIIFFIILWVIWFSIYNYKISEINDIKKNDIIINQISTAKSIIEKLWNIPIPWWTLIFYKKDWTIWNKQNYDIVWWLLCWKQFTNIWIDNKEPFHDKCYKYSITKNKKEFQIWAVILEKQWIYKSILTWNIDHSITKDYIENKLVINNSNDLFPYNPNTKYISAKFMNIDIDNNWKLLVINSNWKINKISKENFDKYHINPLDTIYMKWDNSSAKIKFENEDIIELKWDSIIKLKENEINDNNTKNNIFWLIWKTTYNLYDKENEANLDTPMQTIAIRWDILWWMANIKNGSYNINIWENNKSKIISWNQNLDMILDENNFQWDMFGWWWNIDIENIINIR